MIIIDKGKLKFFLAGRPIDIQVDRRYDRRRLYSVGVRRKHPICKAQILNASETSEGWTLTIRQHTEDTPVFLAANPGAIRADYTTNPARAARMPDGSPIEAERPGPWLQKQAAVASERDDQIRRDRVKLARWQKQGRNTSALQVQLSVAPSPAHSPGGSSGNSGASPSTNRTA